ncbi:zona pellucida sperm-binding protein 3-like, partial [Parambassis ranga]|uniref:Zona pellucida sperm-binding protein 3 n=1 Tax=Parambassis ranga TaxID=210632 RepID=A0A6P7JWD8_9TELE
MVSLLLFLLLSSADGGTEDSKQTNRPAMATLTPTSPPFLHLPMFVDSKRPLVKMEHFSPARRTGQEPIPESLREILLPGRADPSPPPVQPSVPVRTRCRENQMRVQVERSVLGSGDAHAQLTVGTCHASKSTKDYLYFEFDLRTCGTKHRIIDDQLVYSNTLWYKPPKQQGPIRRLSAFSLPVSCYFNRFQYSYKMGYTPKVQIHRVVKRVRSAAKFSLTPRTAQWDRRSPSDAYVLGQPMFFEAEGRHLSEDERLYVHACYVTPEKSHASTPRFAVVKNFGCMVESKDGRSRFVPYKHSAVRFSVDAFLFRGAAGQQLYLHCTMSVGGSAATPTAKSCNYNSTARRWEELFGLDSVCSCCDSNCSSAAPTGTKMIRSRPWTVEPVVRPTPTLRTKTFSTVTTAAAQAEAAEEEEPKPRRVQPETTAPVEVGNMKVELQGPSGGGLEGEETEEE